MIRSDNINSDINKVKPSQPRINPATPFPIPSCTDHSVAELDNKELCQRGSKLDTMVTVKNGDTYAFTRDKYWKLTKTSVEPGYPRPMDGMVFLMILTQPLPGPMEKHTFSRDLNIGGFLNQVCWMMDIQKILT